MVGFCLLRISRAFGIFAVLLLASHAAAAHEKFPSLPLVAYPVVVPGSRLEGLDGKEIAGIRLFASRQGIVNPVPMQIDQVDSRGNWVWSEIVWSATDQHGPMSTTGDPFDQEWKRGLRYGRTYDDQDPGNGPVLDENDLLVFMAKDMGERVANAADLLANAGTTLEIEVNDAATGAKGWVYAAYYASNPPPGSPLRYVQYVSSARKVISTVYEMTFSRKQVGVMEQLAMNGADLLDRTKFRGSLRVGSSRFGRNFSFTENDIEGYVYGYINGPVRVVRRTVASLRFGLLLSSPTVRCDQFFYPYHSEIPVRLPVNFMVHNASLIVAADYHNSPFQRAHTSANRLPISLSGTSSDRNLLEGNSDVHWVALAGDEVSIVSALTVPDEIKPFINVTPWLIYAPGLIDPPEDYPGSEPEAGYRIETRPGLPHGDYLLVGTYLYLPRSFLEHDAEQIPGLVDQKLHYRITVAGHSRTVRGTPPLPRPDPVSIHLGSE